MKGLFTFKKILFIYLPLIAVFTVVIYTGLIYIQWLSDRDAALQKLSRYKLLIDKTEEMREGMIYRYSDIDSSSKVVDIPTRIYDRNGEIIGEFFEQKREIVPYNNIPQWLIKAVIASEDRAFYKHKGVNYKGIARAMAVNTIRMRVVQGGSTITQQLAKVLFTDMERSLKRKIYEAFCAYDIEKIYDKQDILSMYLNLIYFGKGAYGVEAASKMFYGKSVRELNQTECAMIVATISNPVVYSPLNNLDNSIKKTKRILKSMVDAGYIKEKSAGRQYKDFLVKWNVKLDPNGNAESSTIGSFIYSSYRINRAPFFNEEVRRSLLERFDEDMIKKGGLTVYTTIDINHQEVAQRALKKAIAEQRNFHLANSKSARKPEVAADELDKSHNIEGAFISLNPYMGEIIAYDGGYEFSTVNQLDHVRQIKRQPGSSFKPFVYCSAFQDKVITPSTMFVDEPTQFENWYSPSNYSGVFYGNIIVREALRRSVNVVAIKVLKKTGYDTLFSYLQSGLDLESDVLKKRFGKTLSLALGTYEISPLENAILHSMLVNGGDYIKPYGIKYVKDYNGNIVWDNEADIRREVYEKREEYGKIIDPVAAAITISMLKGVFEEDGTAFATGRVYNIDFPVAGKTGTSTNYNDAWFVGYTSELVAAVWVGNKKGAISLGDKKTGGVVSAPAWGEYISYVYRERKPAPFKVPEEGISYQTICLDSGLVPFSAKSCPKVSENELFYTGTEPGEFCNLHPEVKK